MKIIVAVIALVILSVAIGVKEGRIYAQTPAAVTLQGGGPHTTCLAPATGQYYLCLATDGVWVSNNGAAYFQIVAPATSGGVTSISVNGATPMTGPVSLKIPTTAVSTATAPAANFASNGALTLGAPVVTTTIQ